MCQQVLLLVTEFKHTLLDNSIYLEGYKTLLLKNSNILVNFAKRYGHKQMATMTRDHTVKHKFNANMN